MPRPKKQRTIEIVDQPTTKSNQKVILSLDEFEVIKHIDYEHLNQAHCAEHMHVSRTTVQRIYASARQKLALALIEKRKIEVRGGEVETVKIHQDPKFETMMIAIGIENDQIAQHFGKAEKLRLYDVSKGKIIQVRDVKDTNHLKHDRAAFLKSLGVNHILVQHMGKSMYNHFLSFGIQAVQAQSTSIEEAIRLFLEDPAVKRELNPCQICQ
ncbi:MAG TPA: hypothetical protein DIC19_05435 [Erysipelotrichaceae bacterium]|nr:hypothetical protein [Erysipelotrichaceae bacterium]